MAEDIVHQCPICSSTEFSPFLICKDYTVSRESFQIQECEDCGFLLTSPRPSLDTLGDYYKSNDYISHSDTQKGLINWVYHRVRKIALKNKLKLVQKYTQTKGSLLDNGCGTGAFLSTCLQAGWQADGIEPDADARDIAEKATQKSIFSTLDEVKNKKYDAITMWHVLEHIPDLNETIEKLKNLLTERGVLIVAVPNPESDDALYFKEHWAAYDVPRHLWHFKKKDIERLFKKHSCNMKAICPMPFDAYYISLLSTRYKTGKTQYIKALWRGFISNNKAGSTNTSSLIYVIEKNP
jgi:2-polyprenyl-3-methyl-5-hydroxy-6-metoxy-1,4-benzoquinol methylase